MAQQQWYVNQHGASLPPVTARQLVELARLGSLQPEQLVSLDQKKWFKARKVKGLVFLPRSITIFDPLDTPIPLQQEEVTAIMPQVWEAPMKDFQPWQLGECTLPAGRGTLELSHPTFQAKRPLRCEGWYWCGCVSKKKNAALGRARWTEAPHVPP